VAVQGLASSVVAHGGAGVSMAGCFLNITERNAGVECSSDERVSQRVRSDLLCDSGVSGDATDHPPGGMTVESVAGAAHKERSPIAKSRARATRGASGIVTTLPPPLRVTVSVR
jgi:hypothetical protein